MGPAIAIGVAATALHCVRLLLDKVQCIVDALNHISSVKTELSSNETALQSVYSCPSYIEVNRQKCG